MASRTSKWRQVNRLVNEMLDSSIETNENFENQGLVQSINMGQYSTSSSMESIEPLQSLQSLSVSDSSISLSDHSFHLNNDIAHSLSEDLAEWACLRRVPVNTLTQLLKILKCHFPMCELPNDGRTLLKTPRQTIVVEKCGGQFLYLGISQGILRKLEKNEWTSFDIDLLVNIDGLPLFKSSATQVWPILCRFGNFLPFVAALFCGENKPDNEMLFLETFLEEYRQLHQDGIIFKNQHFSVKIKFFSCDAPARQFLKCIKGHTGYNSCERCVVEGIRRNNTTVFLNIDAPNRNDSDFNAFVYDDHQLQQCSLSQFGFNCITGFILDYMHLICLGVTKRFLYYLCVKDGTKRCKLSQASIDQLNNRLEEVKAIIPSEFHRKPRSLQYVKRWKATEFKQFLLYSGIFVFKGILEKKMYEHFLALVLAIKILLYYEDDDSYLERVEYAKNLLRWYVTKCPEFYGESFLSYNVHNLIHIHEDVLHHKMGLQEMSAFEFENHMQVIKKYVRNSRSPLSQINNRISEMDEIEKEYTRRVSNFRIASNGKDGWFISSTNHICRIIEIRGNEVKCDSVHIRKTRSFFTVPCDSKIFDIVFLPNWIHRKQAVMRKTNFLKKLIAIPKENGFVLIPLSHKCL